MGERKPAVIAAPELAAILTRFARMLEKQTDELIEIQSNTRTKVQAAPSLSIVINFDPKTLTATKVSISSTKRATREWNASYGREK